MKEKLMAIKEELISRLYRKLVEEKIEMSPTAIADLLVGIVKQEYILHEEENKEYSEHRRMEAL